MSSARCRCAADGVVGIVVVNVDLNLLLQSRAKQLYGSVAAQGPAWGIRVRWYTVVICGCCGFLKGKLLGHFSLSKGMG